MNTFKTSLILILILSGCSPEKEGLPGNEFESFLSELPVIEVRHISSLDEISYGNYLVERFSTDKLITAEAQVWRLHLVDFTGNLIATAGGMGRGPGEFSVINQIHVGLDNRVYVLDRQLQRISVFSVSGDNFIFEKIMILPDYSPLILDGLYLTSSGFAGVFRNRATTSNDDQVFRVFSLDNELNLNEELFEMAGNDVIRRDGRVIADNVFGQITHWQVYDDRLFYTRSADFSVTEFHFINKTSSTVDIPEIPGRYMNNQIVSDLEERFLQMIQMMPELSEFIQEGESLPGFVNFAVHQNRYFFTLFDVMNSSDEGVILVFDKDQDEWNKISVPSGFTLYGAYGDILFGINHAENNNTLTIIGIN